MTDEQKRAFVKKINRAITQAADAKETLLVASEKMENALLARSKINSAIEALRIAWLMVKPEKMRGAKK